MMQIRIMADNDVKLQFIQDALKQYGDDVHRAMMREINRLDISETNALLNSIYYKVTAANQYSQGEIQLIFRGYGRFVDMGVGKGRALKGSQVSNRNKYAKRKAKKFYSPIAYGLINKLIGNLQYGLTNDVINNIKSQMQSK